MDKEEKQIRAEVNMEATHQNALEVCDLYADGVALERAIQLCGLTKRSFFEAKRTHPDVFKAFLDAKEITAEFRLEDLDVLKASLKMGEIDKDIYKALVSTEQWIITKLRPDLFGNRSTVSISGTISHAPAQVLQSLSDEQILKLIDQTSHAEDKFEKCSKSEPQDAEFVDLPTVQREDDDPYIVVDTPDQVSIEPILEKQERDKSIAEYKKYLDMISDADYIEEVEADIGIKAHEEIVHNPANNPRRPKPDSGISLHIVGSMPESVISNTSDVNLNKVNVKGDDELVSSGAFDLSNFGGGVDE